MAKFEEEYSYDCVSVKNFFHLPITLQEESSYLINEGNRCIVKISERKLVHSWRLKHPHYFTAPIVFDKVEESMYCLIENNTVLQWPYSTAHDDILKIATKFKFELDVFGIIPIHGQKPLVLFASGKAILGEKLGNQAVPLGNIFIGDSETLIWADSLELKSEILILCLSQKNESYLLNYFTVSEQGILRNCLYSLPQKDATLKNWCLNKSTCSFVTIWSDGDVLNYNLETKKEMTLLTIADVEKYLVAIECLDSNHLAIIKFIPKTKGACLEMWDLRFKVVKARKPLKNIGSSDIKLSVIGSSLFFCNGEDLVEVPYSIEKSTLAGGLGKCLSTAGVKEVSWKTKICTDLSSQSKSSVDKMDTSESEQTAFDSTELIALRLMNEGSMCLSYISEAEMVRLLRLAIKYKFKKKSSEGDINIDPDIILNAIFSTSFSEVFLVKSLKKLSLEDTMVALNILSSLLLNEESSSIKKHQKPTDLQLFSWMFLIIQSHMEPLLLSKDKKALKLFRKLQNCISEKMQDCEDIENIQYLLHLIQKKRNIMPEKYVTGKYCIETLDT